MLSVNDVNDVNDVEFKTGCLKAIRSPRYRCAADVAAASAACAK